MSQIRRNILIHRIFTSIFIRPFSTPNDKNEPHILAEGKKALKVARKYTINTLEQLLGIKTFHAYEIASKYKNLSSVPTDLLKKNYKKLIQNGITNETIIKYPEILSLPELEQKLVILTELPYELKHVIPLILIPTTTLKIFVMNEAVLGVDYCQIEALKKNLEISIERACNLICKKQFLCAFTVARIESKIKLLRGFGITTEDICNDLWVLRYSDDMITSRLNLAKQCKIETMKTWMVRAKPDIFQNYIKRRSDNKSILGDNSLAEYLSERLQCDVNVANFMIIKNPALKNKSLTKLKDLIDFLFTAGFQPHHICRVPKILVHSVETTRKRLKQLEEKGIQIDSLYMLTKSQKQFNQYYEALIKSKNKIKSKC